MLGHKYVLGIYFFYKNIYTSHSVNHFQYYSQNTKASKYLLIIKIIQFKVYSFHRYYEGVKCIDNINLNEIKTYYKALYYFTINQ